MLLCCTGLGTYGSRHVITNCRYNPGMADLEAAKALLAMKVGDASLADHVSEILLKVLVERPKNGVALFEQLSAGARAPARAAAAAAAPDAAAYKAGRIAWAAGAEKLYGAVEPTEGVEAAPLPDAESAYLQWAGVGLTPEEGFRTQVCGCTARSHLLCVRACMCLCVMVFA